MEQILYMVQQSQCRSAIKALDPIIEALMAKEMLCHPDMDVNILVTCCISDVLKIVTPYNHEQMRVRNIQTSFWFNFWKLLLGMWAK